ncbi:hypothetical protein [Aurantiacibacter suaedae]|uniref:hypothetical protein n=1 Tax=Aurantiacibacter suaedae TaxID=2545755 RepID=UPI0010F68B2E|nr:hypothetical protein [Aurantiacibacter suaedae]
MARPVPRKEDRSGLVLSLIASFGAICVIGWFVISFGDSSGDASFDAAQVQSQPAPAPTVAATVAPPSYLDDGDQIIEDAAPVGDSASTVEYWSSGPNPDILPSQDPLTREHY